MRTTSRLMVALVTIGAATIAAPVGSAVAAASLQLGVTATSTPTHWLDDRTYEVLLTNDGDEPVSAVTGLVSSPEVPGIAPTLTSPTPVVGDGDDVLESGEQWRYDVTVPTVSLWGFFAEGTVPDGSTVDVFERSAQEPYSSAFEFPASIEIADPGGRFPAGTEVPFTVTATSRVDFPLRLVCEHAFDDAALTVDLQPIGSPTATGNDDDVLDPAELWTWSLAHTLDASGSMLHVFCDVDRADAPTGGLRFFEGGRLIALTLPPARFTLEATPGPNPTFWLEDRTYDLVVTNTGEEPLHFLEIYARSTDEPPDAGEPPPPGQRGQTIAFAGDEFAPGEFVELSAVVPTIASWTFTAVAQTPGGFDVIDQASGERDVAEGTYADPVTIDIAPVGGQLIVIGDPVNVTVTNISGFDVVVTVDASWGRPGGPADSSLAPGGSTSWALAAPSEPLFTYTYEREGVRFTLDGSLDLATAFAEPAAPTTAPPAGTLPATGISVTMLLTLAMLTAGAGVALITTSRRGRPAART